MDRERRIAANSVVRADARDRDSLALASYLASSALCVLLGILGAWGSPAWFSRFPLGYAYDFMDALGAYVLSSAAYFAVRYFLAARGRRLGRRAKASLFMTCFLPVMAHSFLVLTGLGKPSIDLYKRICALLAWSCMAAVAFASARNASADPGRSRPRVSLVARGTLAAWLLVALSSALGFIVELPGILFPSLFAILLVVCSIAVFLAPRAAAPSDANFPDYCRSDARLSPDPFATWGISEREREVVYLILEGKTNSEIAGELFISLSTVKSHIANVFGKTGARNRVEVARLFGQGPRPKA